MRNCPATRAVVFAWWIGFLPAQDWDEFPATEVDASRFFRIESHAATEADVELTKELLCRTIVRLRAAFGTERVDRALRDVDCVVHLHGKATDGASESTAQLVTGTRDGKYTATIKILAPAAFAVDYRDVAGFGPGPDHHLKVLAHEYSTVLLDRLTAGKATGWRFFAGPAWFVQGYEEYLGVAALEPRKRDEALATYMRAQADPDRVRFHPQFAVRDPYVDGATLLHFLHETFGGPRVRAILEAPQTSFDEALAAALGVSMQEVEARWKRWREEALARLDWRKVVLAAKSPREIAAAVVGLDLRHLPQDMRDTVVGALRTLAGKDDYWRTPQDGEPHRVYGVNSGRARWALIVSYPGLTVPGVSWMAVHLFDAGWQQIAVVNFPTGYRIALFDIWQERVLSLQEPVIVVRLGTIGSFMNFTYRERQYYAVREESVTLVRIAQEGGSLTRGVFSASHPWNGPRPPQRTPAQWIEALSSSDPVDVLETLTWLGGRHMGSSEKREPQVNQESLEDAKLWETVRDDPRTRARLAELVESTDGWVREAADLARKTPGPRR